MRKYSMAFLLLAGVFIFDLPEVQADKTCLRVVTRERRNGKLRSNIRTQTVPDGEDCPKKFTDLSGDEGGAGLTGPTGATGATGPSGAAGSANTSTCVRETQDNSGEVAASPFNASFSCGVPGTNGSQVDDVMLGWSYTTSDAFSILRNFDLIMDSGGNYPTGVSTRTTAGNHTTDLDIICCTP